MLGEDVEVLMADDEDLIGKWYFQIEARLLMFAWMVGMIWNDDNNRYNSTIEIVNDRK